MSSLFDVQKQLTFYGSYHSHPVNVFIHIFGVPTLLWSALVLIALIPLPAALPALHHVFNGFLVFDVNASALVAAFYLSYYFLLDPVAALLYTPQLVLSLLTATAYSYRPDSDRNAIIIQLVSWVAQFLGHGLAEGRAPALLDNILGAVVLAPFFVHLELLFKLGYRPQLHEQLQNDVRNEIARLRKEKDDKREAAKEAN
ncbi:hypothetical protein PAXRUDRAFT_833190 [Paxillus rubicundulus Ve08.2h10]|uniref:DUF962-domain-containing protein n=1 Tax=Paxillus rubicundulus Ve08.2h10 TaxID=930991 RepID=A0A0D0DPP7_9AGAM|nr:hypothetical protein PAXRUDRAFT_833190 [Paxillus rubicundulus Ve08.2h10]